MWVLIQEHASAIYLLLTFATVVRVWHVSPLAKFAAWSVIQWFMVMSAIDLYFGHDPAEFVKAVQIAAVSFSLTYATYIAFLNLRLFSYFAICGGFLFLATLLAQLGGWSDYAFRTTLNCTYIAILYILWTKSTIPWEAPPYGRDDEPF